MTAKPHWTGSGAARAIGLLVGLAGIVAVRWAATTVTRTDALVVGLGFGIALLVLGLVGGQRLAPPKRSFVLVGILGAGLLIVIALVARGPVPIRMIGSALPFGPWVAITILVAVTEEIVLRAVVLDALAARFGIAGAVVATSLVFALMHVPLYGWHVVPLDIGVGFWLAGLRLVSGGVAAPALAHALADLVTWWL